MKKRLVILLTITLAFSVLVLASCKHEASKEEYSQVVPVPEGSENYDPESGLEILPEGNGIRFNEEAEGTTIQYKKEEPSKFEGEWEATSDQAAHLYGNFDLTVNSDHTWVANITDEKYSGKWSESKDGLNMKSDRFSFGLAFDEDGTLIMTEEREDGDDFHTVLTRKTADE